MDRIKDLGRYQKAILLAMVFIVLAFTVIYSITVTREGYAYKNAILILSQENGNTIYSGKIEGERAIFTVSPDKTVEFQYGDRVYGPYTVKKDSTAVPEDEYMAMMGIELYCGEEVVFRGGAQKMDDYWYLVNEDGSFYNSIAIRVTTGNGNVMDENGDIEDWIEPSVSNILDLVTEPELAHKGDWFVWFCGVVVCGVTAYSILFADELFRRNLSFLIRNAEDAEPSDWEITSRYIAWTVWPVIAVVVFVVGLI